MGVVDPKSNKVKKDIELIITGLGLTSVKNSKATNKPSTDAKTLARLAGL